ncbi:MAG: long-chain fatty acid--CoA ligase [Gammaproteobacteria bacterium]|nr:long-chain fatty acid--CoA ligase [Gammaproteobacteria bacterium]
MTAQAARSFNYSDLLDLVAGEVPDRPAMVCGDETIPYADFARRVARLAAFLDRRGVRAGDTVALHMGNGPAYLIGLFAACRIGAVPFNVNYRYVGSELEYLYGNAGAAVAIVDAAFLPRVMALAARPRLIVVAGEDAAEAIAAAGAAAIADAAPAGLGVVALGAALAAGAEAPAPARAPRSDDQLVIYTGGTTGMPKGVVWGHEDMLRAALGGGGFFSRKGPMAVPEDIIDRVRESPPLVCFPVAPLMHGAAMWAALASLFAGHTLVLQAAPGFDPCTVLDLVARHRVNILVIVGDGMGRPLADALAAEPGRWALASLVHIGSGGAVFSQAVQQALRQHLPNAMMSSSLGSTEAGTLGAGAAGGEGLMKFPARPDLLVVVDGKRLAAPGETGVLARGGPMPVGYLGDPERTARTFAHIEGRRLSVTGDLARLEADGSITVFGRGSTCINTGGEKVFPEEVEQALKAHPAVLDALVVGQPDPRWGERVTAVVALRAGASTDAAALQEHCRALVAGYKIPRSIVVTDAVRRSNTGKPDYAWAKEQVAAAYPAR